MNGETQKEEGRQVTAQVTHLGINADALSQVIKTLEGTLNPIIIQEGVDSVGQDPVAREPICPLASEIRSLNESIEVSKDKLNALITAIEL